MKEKYLEVEIEMILFEMQDVLTSSLINEDDDGNDVMGDDPYGDF